MLILDTSALFALDQLPSKDVCCPPGVIAELKKYNDQRLTYWEDLLDVKENSEESMRKVQEVASKTGDIGRLSLVDLTVLALAMDFEDGVILTDDYSIQNVARVLEIKYRAIGTPGIIKVEKWNFKCIGCGKWYKEKLQECPICGSQMKSFRKK